MTERFTSSITIK